MTDAAREDLEARSGSATALLRTIVGAVVRPVGGWLSAAGAVELLGSLDIPPATARSSLARLCSRGVLVRRPRDGVAGYAIDPAALPMLERGDARIFGERPPAEAWCLVSFSFPEHQRAVRHRLRRRLAAIGCGTVADGLWIAPAGLEPELAEAVAEVAAETGAEQAGGGAVLFADAAVRGDLAGGLGRWYDLPELRRLHESFLARFGEDRTASPGEPAGDKADDRPGDPAGDRDAFATWIRALDEWRVIPYRDPGLPASALPADWPGAASAALFARLRARLEPRAIRHAARVAGGAAAASGSPGRMVGVAR